MRRNSIATDPAVVLMVVLPSCVQNPTLAICNAGTDAVSPESVSAIYSRTVCSS